MNIYSYRREISIHDGLANTDLDIALYWICALVYLGTKESDGSDKLGTLGRRRSFVPPSVISRVDQWVVATPPPNVSLMFVEDMYLLTWNQNRQWGEFILNTTYSKIDR